MLKRKKVERAINKVKEFHRNEDGSIVEKGIIIALFAALAVGGFLYLAPKVKALFNKAGTELDNADNYTY